MKMPVRAIALALAIFAVASAHALAASPLDQATAGYKYLTLERQGPILIVRFYNPPNNLLTPAMVTELGDLVRRVDADTRTRVVIFTGGVPDFFIEHFDTSIFMAPPGAKSVTQPQPPFEMNATERTFQELASLPKPTIAAINGHAGGGGLELALACDFRIITDPGEVSLSEVTLGVLPGGGGTVRLSRLIGIARAKQLIMLGRAVDAKTAVRFGLVMKAVSPDQLMPAAMQLARRLAALSPTALGYIKSVINTSSSMPLEEALALENHAFQLLVRTETAQHLTKKYLEQGQRWGASQEGLPP